jgi:hypothetical protein
MENSKINVIHVRVDKNKEKIWILAKIALLQKKFKFMGIHTISDEKEFEEQMQEFKLDEIDVLLLDKKRQDFFWEDEMKLSENMKSDEVEMNFEEAKIWLTEMVRFC